VSFSRSTSLDIVSLRGGRSFYKLLPQGFGSLN
jgi:hypothetical protein